ACEAAHAIDVYRKLGFGCPLECHNCGACTERKVRRPDAGRTQRSNEYISVSARIVSPTDEQIARAVSPAKCSERPGGVGRNVDRRTKGRSPVVRTGDKDVSLRIAGSLLPDDAQMSLAINDWRWECRLAGIVRDVDLGAESGAFVR